VSEEKQAIKDSASGLLMHNNNELTCVERAPGRALSNTRAAGVKIWAFMMLLFVD
jgi:hypothetical protein